MNFNLIYIWVWVSNWIVQHTITILYASLLEFTKTFPSNFYMAYYGQTQNMNEQKNVTKKFGNTLQNWSQSDPSKVGHVDVANFNCLRALDLEPSGDKNFEPLHDFWAITFHPFIPKI